jgi:hypothetical protein
MLRGGQPVRRIVFILAWITAAALLLRFAGDFTAAFWPAGGIRRALVPAFWGLVAAALALPAANVLRAGRENASSGRAGAILRASVPVAFLASSLGCSGLAVAGCTAVCTVLRWSVVPLLAAAALLTFSGRRVPPHAALALAAIALVPHCTCINPANAWWVARLGASPMCYAWGFAAALVASTTESAGARPLPALLVNGAIVAGSLAFFAGHHFLRYPW